MSGLALRRSMRTPQTRLAPPLRRAPPGQQSGQPPGPSRRLWRSPVLMPPSSSNDASTVNATTGNHRHGALSAQRLPGPRLTPQRRLFPGRSPRQPHDHRSTGRLETTPRRAIPRGHKTLIIRTARQEDHLITPGNLLVSTHTPNSGMRCVGSPCLVGGSAMGTRAFEPRDRASWPLAASIHQAVMDHGTWSSRGHNPHAYPPIWPETGGTGAVVVTAPKQVICVAQPGVVRNAHVCLAVKLISAGGLGGPGLA